MNAPEILRTGLEVLEQRGIERDQPDGERSMPAVVEAFRALTGHSLTEQQGWLFMALIKIKRSQSGEPDVDHYIDGANYFALAGEAALASPPPPPAARLAADGTLTFADGTAHNLNDLVGDTCPLCAGTGHRPGCDDDADTLCPTCEGIGFA